jgi:hypothetical protein
MPKRRAQASSEIALLRERSLYTLEVIDRADPGARWSMFREAVEDAVTRASLRDLRALTREISGLVAALAPDAQAELRAGLGARFGVEADADRQAQAVAVARIRRRGHLRSEREYRVVQRYADRIAGERGAQDELLVLGGLLDAFNAAR